MLLGGWQAGRQAALPFSLLHVQRHHSGMRPCAQVMSAPSCDSIILALLLPAPVKGWRAKALLEGLCCVACAVSVTVHLGKECLKEEGETPFESLCTGELSVPHCLMGNALW